MNLFSKNYRHDVSMSWVYFLPLLYFPLLLREKLSGWQSKLLEKTTQHQSRDASLLHQLQDAQEKERDAVEMCNGGYSQRRVILQNTAEHFQTWGLLFFIRPWDEATKCWRRAGFEGHQLERKHNTPHQREGQIAPSVYGKRGSYTGECPHWNQSSPWTSQLLHVHTNSS